MVSIGVGGAAAAPLFEPVTVLSRAGNAHQPALQALMGSPSTSAVQVVRIDAAAVNAGQRQRQLEFELLGTPVQALQQRVEALLDGGSVWYGQLQSRSAKLGARAVANDPANSVILVRNGDTVTGSIRKDGLLYRLRWPNPTRATSTAGLRQQQRGHRPAAGRLGDHLLCGIEQLFHRPVALPQHRRRGDGQHP